MAAGLKLDVTGVDVKTPGTYQYWISYNGKLYTNNITIYEPQCGVSNVKSTTTKAADKVTKLDSNN